MMSKADNTMLILIPNIQSKEDLREKLLALIDNLTVDEKTKKIFPSNTLAYSEFEYDCYPGAIDTMEDLFKFYRCENKIVSFLKDHGYGEFRISYHTPPNDEDEYCGGEPIPQDYINIMARNGNINVDIHFYMTDMNGDCIVEDTIANRAASVDFSLDSVEKLIPAVSINKTTGNSLLEEDGLCRP